MSKFLIILSFPACSQHSTAWYKFISFISFCRRSQLLLNLWCSLTYDFTPLNLLSLSVFPQGPHASAGIFHGWRCYWQLSYFHCLKWYNKNARFIDIVSLCTILTFLISIWCKENKFVLPLTCHAVKCMFFKISRSWSIAIHQQKKVSTAGNTLIQQSLGKGILLSLQSFFIFEMGKINLYVLVY